MKAVRAYDQDDQQRDGRPRRAVDYLVCPQCLEMLTRSDLEGFGHCPYCDHSFERNPELEDFLLRPVIKQWTDETRWRE